MRRYWLPGFPESDLSREDRALAQEITLGVLRWQGLLDYFYRAVLRAPDCAFDSPVLIALRIGLYQLRHLTRVPQSAAVNESVNLVRRARVASAASWVNAVLRQAARRLDDIPAPETSTRWSAIRLSCPIRAGCSSVGNQPSESRKRGSLPLLITPRP
jgi:16S rRNA (cytosine967-C5)-methyltransferase